MVDGPCGVEATPLTERVIRTKTMMAPLLQQLRSAMVQHTSGMAQQQRALCMWIDVRQTSAELLSKDDVKSSDCS